MTCRNCDLNQICTNNCELVISVYSDAQIQAAYRDAVFAAKQYDLLQQAYIAENRDYNFKMLKMLAGKKGYFSNDKTRRALSNQLTLRANDMDLKRKSWLMMAGLS